MKAIFDRIDGLLVIAFALVYGTMGWQIPAGIVTTSQIGAYVFPVIISGILFFFGLVMVIKKETSNHSKIWPGKEFWGKAGFFLISLILYAFLIEPVGFIVCTALLNIYLSRLINGSWTGAITTGVAISIALYLLFNTVLDINLPIGEGFEYILYSEN